MSDRSKGLQLLLMAMLAYPLSASAYIGPGGGISAIGVFLALVVGFTLAVFGFVWYPLKRLIRKIRRSDTEDSREKAA